MRLPWNAAYDRLAVQIAGLRREIGSLTAPSHQTVPLTDFEANVQYVQIVNKEGTAVIDPSSGNSGRSTPTSGNFFKASVSVQNVNRLDPTGQDLQPTLAGLGGNVSYLEDGDISFNMAQTYTHATSSPWEYVDRILVLGRYDLVDFLLAGNLELPELISNTASISFEPWIVLCKEGPSEEVPVKVDTTFNPFKLGDVLYKVDGSQDGPEILAFNFDYGRTIQLFDPTVDKSEVRFWGLTWAVSASVGCRAHFVCNVASVST